MPAKVRTETRNGETAYYAFCNGCDQHGGTWHSGKYWPRNGKHAGPIDKSMARKGATFEAKRHNHRK